MLKPSYTSNNGDFILYQGDCFDVLNSIQDNSVNTIFADPPYFLSNGGISCHSGKMVCVDKGEWDKGGTLDHIQSFNQEWLSICRNKLKEDGSIWVSGTHHNIFSIAICMMELGYKILNVVTWQKNNPAPNISCRYFTHSTELIVWARKTEKKSHYFDYDAMKVLNGGKQMTDVWKFPTTAKWEKSCGSHPTQKPLSLLYRIVLASVPKDGVILDPFCGSGTTGIAAALLNRRFIGIEQEKEYVKLAQKRRDEIEDRCVADKYLMKILENNNNLK